MAEQIVEQKEKKRVVFNTAMLYILTIVKLIFPLLTLPYLTRVLSKDTYGMVSYVKSCITYVQLIIDFGFILSSVKDIVNAKGDKQKIGLITGHTFLAKFILCCMAGVVMLVMCFSISILRQNVLFSVLCFASAGITVFFADFLFRGIEKMHFITIMFLTMKAITTVLTFVFVKGDSTVLWVPILDIIGNLAAVLISVLFIIKLKIPIKINSVKTSLYMIKDSFTYFLSNVASTAFYALNTLIIGIYFEDLSIVAQWSLCLSIISAIQGLYAPICNGVYPYMIKKRQLSFIHKVMLIFMPLITLGCILCFVLSKFILYAAGGDSYVEAYVLFRWMIPILFFSFPAQLYGWPTLGAIGKAKETTISTIVASVAQVIGLVLLIIINQFTLISLAILRFVTELLMLVLRMFYTYKNKDKFVISSSSEDDSKTDSIVHSDM